MKNNELDNYKGKNILNIMPVFSIILAMCILFILTSYVLSGCAVNDFDIKYFNNEKIYVANDITELTNEDIKNYIVDRTDNWTIITENEEIDFPEEGYYQFNYDEYVNFMKEYNLAQDFNDENAFYTVLINDDISWNDVRILKIDNKNIYYYEDFAPLAPEYKSEFIIIRTDNKVDLTQVYSKDQYYDLKHPEEVTCKKPVIYVYDDLNREVDITLKKSNNTDIDLEYPVSDKGTWHIKASSNGNINYNERNYNYLYWEDNENISFYRQRGYCVKGEDTAEFLEYALEDLGLNQKEIDDFITYWLPEMVNNKYNIIEFNPEEYRQMYKLSSSPKADNIITVFMVYTPSDVYIDLEPQHLGAFNDWERNGLTIVEWGGAKTPLN